MSERLLAPDFKPTQAELLEEALTMPGSMGNTYNRFRSYSLGNQALLYMQGATEPVNTFKRWPDLNRHVKKGARAKSILVPLVYKEKDEHGKQESKIKGFKMTRCLFELSDTEGDDLPEYEPPEWSEPRALGELAIKKVQFESINGNIAGYSQERNIAISPIAPYPFKTLMHETAHVVLNHTTEEGLEEYRQHRGVAEFEAEGSAYLVMNALEATDQFDAAESREYIRGWLQGQTPPEVSIKKVFSTADKIVAAGRGATE
ncbi:ArdC-like ssDNA-binding domain-containing protein [Subtercola sp. RTI3]|uniref:ArdC-like ssDNA-binding domain-containing protein n=1 Tax=Subtercola sp. RTI3 TaxID=3048639 RepID=UPI002B23BF89|nr:ArdC-like ssDNA-binding domain-containing protein [Subtercola sp. RTI3]MEA9985672.1 ArdC-like ssDNA-binding domain-containing protein [Subtercola sp. RTI3]